MSGVYMRYLLCRCYGVWHVVVTYRNYHSADQNAVTSFRVDGFRGVL